MTKEEGVFTFLLHHLFTDGVRTCVHAHEHLTLSLVRPEAPVWELWEIKEQAGPAQISPESRRGLLASGHLGLGKQIWPCVCHELDEN